MDFDNGEDLEAVREHTYRLGKSLSDAFGIPVDSMRYCFTGMKGFTLEIPSSLFNAQPDEKI